MSGLTPSSRVITAIEPHPRRPGRYVVEVDGAAAATASVAVIDRLGLTVGGDWSAVETEVVREGAVLDAFDRGASLLASRGRSRASLVRLLVRRGIEKPVAQLAVDRLTEAGYADDAAYARQVARTRATSGYSRRRIAQELLRVGVDRSIAAEAIDETFAAEGLDEAGIVEDAARKKLRSLAGLEPGRRRQRLWAHLARRGYSVDLIRAAVQRVESGEGDEGPR